MNSYFIFAIVLTVAYIIYYAVIIAHDLYGKKGTDKPDEEVFDLGATAQEKLERLKAEAEEQMEETTPYLSDARTSEEMYKAMISKGRLDNRPEIKWNPIQDRL